MRLRCSAGSPPDKRRTPSKGLEGCRSLPAHTSRLLCSGGVSVWSERGVFAEYSAHGLVAPFRLVPAWIVEPPMLCFVQGIGL